MGLLLWIGIADALGAEASAGWRPTYDLVMRWLNFGILVVLFFKYARKPLVSFLKGQASQIEKNIQSVEAEKEAIEARVRELEEKQAKSRERFKAIEERIISHGELKKQRIIEDAHTESRLLLESAKRRMAYEIIAARQNLRNEIVDQAVDLAIQNLPNQMTDQDAHTVLQSKIEDIQSLRQS
jgi:F-type H+-transporting ATPase subunit b